MKFSPDFAKFANFRVCIKMFLDSILYIFSLLIVDESAELNVK